MFLSRYFVLTSLDEVIAEFFDSATLDAYDVVVVFAAVQLENRVSTFEMMAFDQACGLELCQDSVNCSQADFFTLAEQ